MPDAAAIGHDQSVVDVNGNLGNVADVNIPEWGVHIKRFVCVVRNLALYNFDRFIGFAQIMFSTFA